MKARIRINRFTFAKEIGYFEPVPITKKEAEELCKNCESMGDFSDDGSHVTGMKHIDNRTVDMEDMLYE